MGSLTETEIFDCMAENLRLAIGHARELAVSPRKGPGFIALRAELKLVEGACRQAAVWRQDSRWYPIGMMMEDVHQRAKEWLRGVVDPETGQRRMIPEGVKHPLFSKLADNLEALLAKIDELRTRATGRMGMILPGSLPGPHRQTRDAYGVLLPDGMSRRDSGVIVPSSAAA